MAGAVQAKDEKQKAHPNLSGTWTPDKTRSDPSENTLDDQQILVIEYNEPQIKIIRKLPLANGRELGGVTILFTDGRGETNRALVGLAIGDVKSKTEWKGEKLVRRYTTRRTVRAAIVDVSVTEEMKLSDGGQTLVQTFRYVIPRPADTAVRASLPPLEIKRVYNRAQ